MAGNRGRRKPPVKKIEEEEEEEEEVEETAEGFVEDEKPHDSEVVRSQLRDRWELASVLNFLRVFKSVIGFKMEVSAEEIEEGLINPNNCLSQLHICLLKILQFCDSLGTMPKEKMNMMTSKFQSINLGILLSKSISKLFEKYECSTTFDLVVLKQEEIVRKQDVHQFLWGIPPVSKNLGPDVWVTILIKKLVPWWRWVAEGEIPLIIGNGKEILKYSELDPMMRLLILKALCEIRAFQDDMVRYINDSLKEGTEISTFREDRIGGDGNGTSYWYDGDESIGHRLYKEVTKVQLLPKSPKSPKSRGKGRPTQLTTTYQWKTIATNLEEFQQISIKLSSSKVVGEAAVAQVIKNEIVPVLEKIQKKKERSLKRKQRQEMLLNGVANSYRTEGIRSCRNRTRVSYTFDEYDKSIDEALQLIKKGKTTRELKKEKKDVTNGHADVRASNGICENNDSMDNDADFDKLEGVGGESDSNDEDFDHKNDENDNKNNDEDDDDGDNDANGDSASSENENNNSGMGMCTTRLSRKQKGHLARDMADLRRSMRHTGNAGNPDKVANQPADTKKKLRQRPIHNTGYEPVNVTDSEGSNLSEKTSDEASDRMQENTESENQDASESEENIENEEKMDATESEENLENEEIMDAIESEEKNIETGEQMDATESEEENSENEKVDDTESEEENIESEGEATQSESEEN